MVNGLGHVLLLVVANSGDHLQDELAVADNSRGAGAVVRVLVLKTIVLFVHADDVLEVHWSAFGIGPISIEILDMAEAITSQRQLVRCDAESNVTNIEGLLTMVGCAGI